MENVAKASGLCTAVLLLATCAATAAPTIEWEVLERFPTISGLNESAKGKPASVRDRLPVYIQRVFGYMNRAVGSKGTLIDPKIDDIQTIWKPRDSGYDHGRIHRSQTKVLLTVSGISSKARCSWKVGLQPATAPSDCRNFEATVTLGSPTAVSVDPTLAGKALPTVEIKAPLVARSVKVVVIGDSFVSGEGNPHLLFRPRSTTTREDDEKPKGQPTLWWDHRCHRSLLSGAAIGAAQYASANKDASVHFLTYACSGAEITPGVLHKQDILDLDKHARAYEGRETAWQISQLAEMQGVKPTAHSTEDWLPAQLDRLEHDLCPEGQYVFATGRCSTPPAPDFLIISVGGNDIGFGSFVRRLALGKLGPEDFVEEKKKVQKKINGLLALEDARVANLITQRLAPKRVLVMEYPNPSRKSVNGKSEYCRDRLLGPDPSFVPGVGLFFGLGITAEGAQFAEQAVLKPLNIRRKTWVAEEVARGRPWVLIDGIEQATLAKGYCSSSRWFINYSEAQRKQGEIPVEENQLYRLDDVDGDKKKDFPGGVATGAMHPNIFFHIDVAGRIVAKMKAQP